MASAKAETSRCRQALADIPAKPSRGHCGDGFFYRATLTFGILYCFFVISHDRRKILHCNVTRQPNAFWIVLQLREAWGFEPPPRFLIFDRDSKFSAPA